MIEINQKKLCENCFAEIAEEVCPHCGYPDEQAAVDMTVLPVGTKVGNKILIGKVMGKGGFGVTYLGYDLRMEKIIAVKEYYPNGISYRSANGKEVSLADPKSEETFQRGAEKFYSEAEIVAQFNGNPNIVGVYDYFRENNTVYLVMEYINGITLKQYIHDHGKISDAQALFIMDKIAAALSITHSASVLHRDISPDNIMICSDGKIKLIDFGAARQIMAESSSNLTVVLKPGYTPIEQYTKKGRQGAWTDIYALGVSMYYALTGTTIDDPYERMDGDDEWEKNKHGIHNGLWKILKKCTMIQAADRYENAIELRKALSAISGNLKPQTITIDEKENTHAADNAETAKESIPATAPGEEPQDEAAKEPEDSIPATRLDKESQAETAKATKKNKDTKKAKDSKKTKDTKESIPATRLGEQLQDETAETPAEEDSASETKNTQEDLDSITQDLPVDESGYDPSVNIYKKKRGKQKGKRLIAAAAALAAVLIVCVVGIILANRGDQQAPDNLEQTSTDGQETGESPEDMTDEFPEDIADAPPEDMTDEFPEDIADASSEGTLEIRMGNRYPGAWGRSNAISKEDLESFGTDVSVTLNAMLVSIDREEEDATFYFAVKPITGDDERPVHISAETEPRETSEDNESVYDFARGSDSFTFVITVDEIAELSDEGLAFLVWNVIPLYVELSPAQP